MIYTLFRDYNVLKRLDSDKCVPYNSDDMIVLDFKSLRDAIRYAIDNCYTSIAQGDCEFDPDCETIWFMDKSFESYNRNKIKESKNMKLTKSELKNLIKECLREELGRRSVREKVSKRDDIDAMADNKKEKAKRTFLKAKDDADSDRDYKLKKNKLREYYEEDEQFNYNGYDITVYPITKYNELAGYEPGDLDFDDSEAIKVYEPADEDGEMPCGLIGVELADGTFGVVGMGLDTKARSRQHMLDMITSCD